MRWCMRKEQHTNLYLKDILNSINAIEKYVKSFSFEKYLKDQKTIDAVIRNFEIIGEAANALPNEFVKKHSDIPWNKIISMRHKMIHEYFGVDQSVLWQTICNDLPILKKQVRRLFKK